MSFNLFALKVSPEISKEGIIKEIKELWKEILNKSGNQYDYTKPFKIVCNRKQAIIKTIGAKKLGL